MYVKKFVDMSDKYGIGYALTNNSCGVYFNDTTKIILSPDMNTIDYICRDQNKAENRERYSITDYPSTLKKKVTLLLHFKNTLELEKPKPESSS